MWRVFGMKPNVNFCVSNDPPSCIYLLLLALADSFEVHFNRGSWVGFGPVGTQKNCGERKDQKCYFSSVYSQLSDEFSWFIHSKEW